jgi:hypothetical protein
MEKMRCLRLLLLGALVGMNHGCNGRDSGKTGAAIDNPMSIDLFDAAIDLPWTRDPFDRLIVAHARVRGWRLATGDRKILGKLPETSVIAL